MIKNQLRYAVAAAFLFASGITNVAFGVEEDDVQNNSFSSPQKLLFVSKEQPVVITGAVGVMAKETPFVDDVDYYFFHGRAGDVVDIDIDGGWKSSTSTVRNVDTLIAIWGPGLFHQNDDAMPLDSGSTRNWDSRLDKILLPANGIYKVGVTSGGRVGTVSRIFLPEGGATAFVGGSSSNGSYTLTIVGVSPSEKQISIDIRPGHKKTAKINPNSKRKIKVALLSSRDVNDPSKVDFDATKVDRASITFGPKDGAGTSGLCGKTGTAANHRRDDDDDDEDDDDKDRRAVKDVDRNGLLDLVCRFEIRAAGFDESDTEGVIKGTIDGMPFEGRGWLKVIPAKKRHHDDD
jgi:hypothetical protein